MPGVLLPETAPAPVARHGFITEAPAKLGAPFRVTVPEFDELHVYEVRRWSSRATTLPAVGDEVLVVVDDVSEPWVVAWWPVKGDSPIEGPEGPEGPPGPEGPEGPEGPPGPGGSIEGLFNVKATAYGAKGDGATDDATAIQKALDAAGEAGGIVYFPPGTYIVGKTLVLKTGVRLMGANVYSSVLKLKDGANTDLLTTYEFSEGGIANVALDHLSFNGNKAKNAEGNGLVLDFVSSMIDWVFVFDCAEDGIYHQKSAADETLRPYGEMECIARDVKVWDCEGYGFDWGGHDCHFTDCITISNEGGGFYFRAEADACKLNACHGYGKQDFAFKYEGSNMRFINCDAEGATTANVVVAGDNGQWIGGEVFRDADGAGKRGFLFKKGKGYNTLIDGVRSRNQTEGTFAFESEAAADNSKISGLLYGTEGTAIASGVGLVEPDASVKFDVKLYGGLTAGSPFIGRVTVESLSEGWIADDPVRYWREGETVHIEGRIHGGKAGKVFTLPVGLRPLNEIICPAGSAEGTLVTILANGEVKRAGTAAMILTGISFRCGSL